jgi:tripartite-type tricarboxylate transporter receptor subunit TctC
MKNIFLAALLAALAAGAIPAGAQERYPAKPIQLIVALATATTADILARMYAEKLTGSLGQPVVVQNRPGAGGSIASQAVATAAPDGYTLLMTNSAHSINPALYNNLPYDTLRDFVGIAIVAESPALVVVNPQLGARTLKEFIAAARQKPGVINYGSAGVGTATHLAGAYFASQAGIDLTHVPYKTSPDLIADLLTGRIQATFVPPAFLLSQIREGKLLALGVSTAEPMRAPLAVPSVREAAGVDYEYGTWYGLLAPARTPVPVLEALNRAIQRVAEDKDVREKYVAQGVVPRNVSLREFDAFIKADMDKLGPLVKASGARGN